MRIVVLGEIILLFTAPFLLAVLKRRYAISTKLMAFVLATILSLLVGTYSLYLTNAKTLFSLTFKDWLLAVFMALFSWIVVYLLCRWFLNELVRK